MIKTSSTPMSHTASVVFTEKVNRLCVAHFEVHDPDAASEQLPDISDTHLRNAENLVREAINLPITKLTQTSQGNVGVGAAVS